MDLSKAKEVYKIQRSDGLFSSGGYRPQFSKNGKIWKRLGDLTQHLNIVVNRYSYRPDNNIYGKCQIVKYLLTAVEVQRVFVDKQMEEIRKREHKKQAAALRRAEERQKRKRQKQYDALKKEFE